MPNLTPLEAAEKLEELSAELAEQPETWMQMTCLAVASYLRKIAAGEYQPVVQGHFENQWSGEYDYFAKCSVCHADNLDGSNFCRMCGALMDGKDDRHET